MAMHNPTQQGVATKKVVQRQDLDVSTSGKAVVTSVRVQEGLEYQYTGADAGTGDVLVGLPRIPGMQGRVLTTVVVDSFGRVVDGTDGNLTSDYVLASPGERQPVQVLVNSLDATLGVIHSATIHQANIGVLVLSGPLGIDQGGTGVSTVPQRAIFAGPEDNDGPPVWRSLNVPDIPMLPWSHITHTPSTLNGYGITDAYTRAETDAKIFENIPEETGEPVIVPGSLFDYWRGDKTWQILYSDVIVERFSLFWTQERSRQAQSVVGPNLQYNPNTGTTSFSPTPSFTQISVSSDPTQANQVATKHYVDAQSPVFFSTEKETITVQAGVRNYILQHTPNQSKKKARVMVNGLEQLQGSSDTYTIVGALLMFNADVALYVGDRVVAEYEYET